MTGVGEQPWTPGSLLGVITPEERAELLALGTPRTLPGGRRLLAEDRRDTQVEVILRGLVKVTTAVGGVPRLLAVRLPGDIVGEFAAFTGNGRIATVTTCGQVVSSVIRQADFLHFVGEHPQVAAQITALVGRRLRWSNERRSEFPVFAVHVRLARILLELAASCGRPVEDGVMLTVELSQTELAELVGAREDTVQRALRRLRAQRFLRTGYRRIVVLDEPGLRALIDRAEWS